MRPGFVAACPDLSPRTRVVECGVYRGVLSREPSEILPRRRPFAQVPAQLHFEREQFGKQLGQVAIRSPAQVILDPRPQAGPPAGLVALARRIDPPGPRELVRLGHVRTIDGHGTRPRSGLSQLAGRGPRRLAGGAPTVIMTIGRPA